MGGGSRRGPAATSVTDRLEALVAAMILSGNRFIGTLAGGQGISMTG